MVKEISEHSVDISLLNRWSKVLDLGSRNFGFAKALLEYVDTVCCVDADDSIISMDNHLPFLNVAIGNIDYSFQKFVKWGNGTGNFIYAGEPLPQEHMIQDVETWTLDLVSKFFDVEHWDLIKFDIEGSEYDVLMNLAGAPAKQITFELHEHTMKKRGSEFIGDMFKHLEQWYDFRVMTFETRHGAGYNYWDVLMIEK